MKKELLISIVVPTYKRSDQLERAIASILKQAYCNIEVIVVDDNDPESSYRKATEKVLVKYDSDNRVKYFRHAQNLGGAAARNTGIINSSGEFIGFLDDDDFFLPGKLSKQIDFLLNHENFHAVYCGSKVYNKNVEPILEGNLAKELLQFKTSIFTPTLVFYRQVLIDLNGFDESFARHQDYELLLRFFQNNYKIGVVPEVLVSIGENEGENTLHGKELENLKRDFLREFHPMIESLEKENKGFKREIYCKNYSIVFLDYLVRKKFKDSSRIFNEHFSIYKLEFVWAIIDRFSSLVIRKFLSKI